MWSLLGKFIVKNWKYIHIFVTVLLKYIKMRRAKKPSKNIQKIIEIVVDYFDKKTNTGIIDPFDQAILRRLLESGWSLAEMKANPVVMKAIEQLADAIMTGDDANVIDTLTVWVNGEIDIPHLNEIEEAEVFKAVFITIAFILRGIIRDE